MGRFVVCCPSSKPCLPSAHSSRPARCPLLPKTEQLRSKSSLQLHTSAQKSPCRPWPFFSPRSVTFHCSELRPARAEVGENWLCWAGTTSRAQLVPPGSPPPRVSAQHPDHATHGSNLTVTSPRLPTAVCLDVQHAPGPGRHSEHAASMAFRGSTLVPWAQGCASICFLLLALLGAAKPPWLGKGFWGAANPPPGAQLCSRLPWGHVPVPVGWGGRQPLLAQGTLTSCSSYCLARDKPSLEGCLLGNLPPPQSPSRPLLLNPEEKEYLRRSSCTHLG